MRVLLIPSLVLSLGLAARATPPAPVAWEPSLLVQIQVKDLDRSIRFYEGVLGFKVVERLDDLQFAHVDCGVNGLQLGLSAGEETPPNPGTVVLNFGVKGDVEKARKALEARGVEFVGPTVVIPGKVRLAEFRDPDGHRLRLAGGDSAAR